MSTNPLTRLQDAARNTTRSEGMIKLVAALTFVPVPILLGGMGGFLLDYYRFHTLPLLVIAGTLLGTIISFAGVFGIVVYGHKGGTR